LIAAILGESPATTDFDAEQFTAALAAEREDCKRHYSEYCKNERWSYVPG
jgi:hypothetical protein